MNIQILFLYMDSNTLCDTFRSHTQVRVATGHFSVALLQCTDENYLHMQQWNTFTSDKEVKKEVLKNLFSHQERKWYKRDAVKVWLFLWHTVHVTNEEQSNMRTAFHILTWLSPGTGTSPHFSAKQLFQIHFKILDIINSQKCNHVVTKQNWNFS